MRIRTVLVLVVAVVCGTAGSRMSKRLFSSPPEAKIEKPEENVPVMAAKQPISPGTILREPEHWFEERMVPKSQEPSKAVKRLYHLRGRRLVRALDAQAIVTADHLAEEEQEGNALLKKEGRLAVDIAVASLHGFVFPPEAHVDVLAESSSSVTGDEAPPIARNLPLLGVRTASQEVVIATLAATPQEAQQLQRAAAEGNLRLRFHARR